MGPERLDGPPGGFVLPDSLFGAPRPLVGMVHLLPLPGAPGALAPMDRILERAVRDARILEEGGLHGILVENYGDVPFHPGRVPPETVAGLAVAVDRLRSTVSVPVGVNVLRNDARSALGIAAATGAAFIRVNVHTGSMFTDQGLLEGRAHETLRERRRLAPGTAILADVLVKHAAPPPGVTVAGAARDLRYRGRADVLVVSGAETGRAPSPERIRTVKEALPEAPVWVGSGLTPESAAELLDAADGAVVGSSLQRDGRAGSEVDPARVRRFMAAVPPAP